MVSVTQDDLDALNREEELREMTRGWSRQLSRKWTKWRNEAKENYSLRDSDQWAPEDRQYLEEAGRVAPVFNRIAHIVSAVVGAAQKNRLEAKYYARSMDAEGRVRLVQAVTDWIRDESNLDDHELDALEDCLTCGVGVIETFLEFDTDPNGMIRSARVDPVEVEVDPGATQRCYRDARYLRRKKKIPKDVFKEVFGFLPSGTGGDIGKPSTHTSNPADDYDADTRDSWREEDDEIVLTEWQWYDLKYDVEVLDMTTGETLVVSKQDARELEKEAVDIGLPFYSKDLGSKRIYKRAFFVGSEFITEHELPENRFTYTFLTGKRDRNEGYFYGIVRLARDPQKFANKFLGQFMHIMSSQANGGVIFNKKLFDNPREVQEKWSRPDTLLFADIPVGSDLRSNMAEKPSGQYPVAVEKMMLSAFENIRECMGVSPEFLAMADRDQPGILESQRKEATFGVLGPYFDALRAYRKDHAKLLLKMAQLYIDDGRIIRVVGKQSPHVQHLPVFRDQLLGDFDVVVDEAPHSPNMKERTWLMISQLMPMLSKTLPPQAQVAMLKYSPLPQDVVQEIQQIVGKASQQQSKIGQAMQQLEMALKRAELKKTDSETQENLAQVQKILAEARSEYMPDEQDDSGIIDNLLNLEMKRMDMAIKSEDFNVKREQMRQKSRSDRMKAEVDLRKIAQQARSVQNGQ